MQYFLHRDDDDDDDDVYNSFALYSFHCELNQPMSTRYLEVCLCHGPCKIFQEGSRPWNKSTSLFKK